ncbi:MAG: WYL domain-containing protein [Actinomycetota bacterium]|nr:WYL domain-containing protein [Actinomycetota bacterium]
MVPDRLERVTDLLLVLLDTPRPLSLREIADRVPGYPTGHGARRQAFERDKRLLRDEGVPVLVEPIGGDDQLGYRVDPEQYYLPALDLGPAEQAALNLAVAGVHLGEPTAGEALTKLGALGAGRGATASAPVVGLATTELARLAALHDALRHQAVVEFPYRGEKRTVDPAGLRFTRGRWYLVGYDRGRSGGRTFRVDRMEAAPTAGEPGTAALPAGFDAAGAFARDPWQFGAGDEVVVDVEVDAVAAGSVVAELGPSVVAERRSDGSVLVRLTVNDEEALVRWVLGLLDHAEIVAPAEVRARLVDRLAALAAVTS